MFAKFSVSLLLAALLVGEAACVSTFPGAAPAEGAGHPITLTILNHDTGRIAPGFVGLSYEKAILSTPLFSAANLPLVRLFRLLGPGLLRIGGNSVNETLWNPAGRGLTRGETAPADIERLAGFLRATGWRVIYGLNGTTSSPERSAQEAAFAAQALGTDLYDFEIGNEPDVYPHNGLEARDFSFSDFLRLWNSYRRAILARVPDARFSGPAAAADYRGYALPFARTERKHIELLTQHYYRGNGRSVPPPTIGFLLKPDPRLKAMADALRRAASTNHIPLGYRIAEANSFYPGGVPGLSNTFGSALWVLQFAFTLAAAHAAGLNLHGGGDYSGYTPIANKPDGSILEARPEYYGLYLFSRLEGGKLLATRTSYPRAGVEAYAVERPHGKIAVLLLNTTRDANSEVTVRLPFSPVSGSMIRLRAPALDAVAGVTLGGAHLTSAGRWAPHPPRWLSLPAGYPSVRVPAASALLMILSRP